MNQNVYTVILADDTNATIYYEKKINCKWPYTFFHVLRHLLRIRLTTVGTNFHLQTKVTLSPTPQHFLH